MSCSECILSHLLAARWLLYSFLQEFPQYLRLLGKCGIGCIGKAWLWFKAAIHSGREPGIETCGLSSFLSVLTPLIISSGLMDSMSSPFG